MRRRKANGVCRPRVLVTCGFGLLFFCFAYIHLVWASAWRRAAFFPNGLFAGLVCGPGVPLLPWLSRSQRWEENFVVATFFNGNDGPACAGGVFIEMGAFNGLLYSNTWLLERCLGWTGLLIEANPSNFEDLTRNRPGSGVRRIHAAVCEEAEERRNGTVPFTRYGGAVAGDLSAMSPSFRARWHGNDEREDPVVQVPCRSLSGILREAGVGVVDFFSLDVEGAELKALRTVDFDATRIKLVVVEADGHDTEKDAAVRQLLRSRGFRRVLDGGTDGGQRGMADGENDVFVHQSHINAGCATRATLAPP